MGASQWPYTSLWESDSSPMCSTPGGATPKNAEGLHPRTLKAPACTGQNGRATPKNTEGPFPPTGQTGHQCPAPWDSSYM